MWVRIKGSEEPVHTCSLARASSARTHGVWVSPECIYVAALDSCTCLKKVFNNNKNLLNKCKCINSTNMPRYVSSHDLTKKVVAMVPTYLHGFQT